MRSDLKTLLSSDLFKPFESNSLFIRSKFNIYAPENDEYTENPIMGKLSSLVKMCVNNEISPIYWKLE